MDKMLKSLKPCSNERRPHHSNQHASYFENFMAVLLPPDDDIQPEQPRSAAFPFGRRIALDFVHLVHHELYCSKGALMNPCSVLKGERMGERRGEGSK